MGYFIVILAALSLMLGSQYGLSLCVFLLLIDCAIVRYDLNKLFKLNDQLMGNLALICYKVDHLYDMTNELRTEIVTLKRAVSSRIDG
jgi:hypothetical protein